MISIGNIQKHYHNGEVHALSDITAEVREGEFVILVGSNGSGKSTLLNVIAGSILPDAGQIKIDGTDVTTRADYKRSKWISRVFQNPSAGTAGELTILENFRLASLRTSAKALKTGTSGSFRTLVKERLAELNLGLENKLDVPMGNLSGGQRQALTLLMAVMDDTRLLLMDEPVSALDPGTADLVMRLADNLIQKHRLTSIMVTHSLRDAHRYGSRILQLAGGKIIRDISGADKKNLSLDQLYSWF